MLFFSPGYFPRLVFCMYVSFHVMMPFVYRANACISIALLFSWVVTLQ